MAKITDPAILAQLNAGTKEPSASASSSAAALTTPAPSASEASPASAPAKKSSVWESIKEGFGKALPGTAQALNTRPEQLSGSLLSGGFKVRPKTEEEEAQGPTSAANRARRMAGMVQGAVIDPVMAATQLMGGTDTAAKQNAAYEQFRQSLGDQGFDVSRIVGNVASPVGLKGASMVANATKGAGLVRQGATQGALAATLAPTTTGEGTSYADFLADKATQLGGGAALGGILGKVLGPGAAQQAQQSVTSRGLAIPGQLPPRKVPPPGTAGASQIANYEAAFPGAYLTPGQRLGFEQVEQQFMSSPFVGQIIRDARSRALQDQNIGMMNKALEPAGLSITKKETNAGRELFDNAYLKLNKAYDNILNESRLPSPDKLRAKIQGTGKVDANGDVDLGVIGPRYQRLSEAGKEKFDKILENDLFKRFGKNPQGEHTVAMSGKKFKEHEERFKEVISDLMEEGGESRTIGKMLKDSLDTAYQSLEGTTPEVSKQLKKLNKAYANYKTLETASTASGASEGLFTPTQAIKAATKGSRGQVAKGKGLLQAESEMSQQVMGKAVPDSGTAGRLRVSDIFSPSNWLGAAAAIPVGLAYSPQAANLIRGTAKLNNKIAASPLGQMSMRHAMPLTGGLVRGALGPSGADESME